MVGVAFICCTFVAKMKCHDDNKPVNYLTYIISTGETGKITPLPSVYAGLM